MESKIYNPGNMTVAEWHETLPAKDFPVNEGVAIRYNNTQIAIYNFTDRGEWYASQNLCPHKQEMALSRGIIGDAKGEPKIACPFHKKSYSLKSGKCLSGDEYNINTYPVKVENGLVYVGIPQELLTE